MTEGRGYSCLFCLKLHLTQLSITSSFLIIIVEHQTTDKDPVKSAFPPKLHAATERKSVQRGQGGMRMLDITLVG